MCELHFWLALFFFWKALLLHLGSNILIVVAFINLCSISAYWAYCVSSSVLSIVDFLCMVSKTKSLPSITIYIYNPNGRKQVKKKNWHAECPKRRGDKVLLEFKRECTSSSVHGNKPHAERDHLIFSLMHV